MPDDKKEYPIFKVLNMGGQGLRKNAYLILLGLAKYADNDTGKCYPSIPTLSDWSGKSETAVHEAITELTSKGRISVERGGGRKPNHYTINFDLRGTESVPLEYGIDTPAVRNANLRGADSGGELLYLSSGKETSWMNEAEATPASPKDASASASAEQEVIHTAQTDKDQDLDHSIKTTNGTSPVQSVKTATGKTKTSEKASVIPVSLTWEQENEDALIAWKGSYGRPYELADFPLIEAKYGERIKAVCDGHGTLPLLIKWACHIGKDFPDLKDTTELREEFPHILLKVTAYIAAGELTPRIFIKRVEDKYWKNLICGGWGEPNPQDVLEEEYMWECEERETSMDLLNPWGEDDAKQVQTEFYPWEEDRRSETTPDCAVTQLAPEEKQEVDLDCDDVEVEGMEVAVEAAKPVSIHDHIMDHVADSDHERTPADPSIDDSDDGEILGYKQPQEPITKSTIPAPIEDWVDANARRHASIPVGGQRRHQTHRQFVPEPSASAGDEDELDCEVENVVKKEPVAFVDSKNVWEQLAVLKDVWKEVSDGEVILIDFRHILRDNKSAIPEDNPVEYLAAVIRWAMVFWPKRGELKHGSMSFAGRIKEILQDYAGTMSKAEAGEHKEMFVDPNEDL